MEELLFNIVDCTSANITTPNVADDLDLISEIQESPQVGSTNIQKYTIEFSKNCCPSTLIDIPVFYNFSRVYVDCNFNVGTGIYSYGFNLLGINPLFVTSIRISKNDTLNYLPATFTNVFGNTGIHYDITYAQADVTIANATLPDPPNTQDYTFYLEVTHTSGFIYIIRMTFRLEQPGGCSTLISSSIVSTVYPEIDERIVFDTATSIDLLPLYGAVDTLYSGIYEVIICRWRVTNALTLTSLISECVQNNYFIDCQLKCEIVNKLVQCKDTNIMTYYRALQFANDCNTSYQDMCDMYELMMNKLNNPDCSDPYDDCNCGDSRDQFFTQRSYNNNRTATRSCGSCKS
jgi:hypothetical protein